MPIQIQNTRRFGVEWVNNYASGGFSPARSNLIYCELNATKFYNKISGLAKFNYGNNQAWDIDFEQNFPPAFGPNAAGDDDSIVEKADIAYFSGHGTQDGMLFGISGYDNGEARFDELQLGQQNVLKWLVVDACQFLQETGAIVRLGPRFQGLRYMLGFHGDCRNTPDRGLAFATQLNGVPSSGTAPAIPGEKIWYAWYIACIQTEGIQNPGFACLRAGDSASAVHNDRWTDDNFLKETSSNFTYFREVFLPA